MVQPSGILLKPRKEFVLSLPELAIHTVPKILSNKSKCKRKCDIGILTSEIVKNRRKF